MTACPKCREAGRDRSGDNLGVFENGVYCFRCGYREKTKPSLSESVTKQPKEKQPIKADIEFESLPHRKISREACVTYGYGTATDSNGTKWEIATHFDKDGNAHSQKCREFGTCRTGEGPINKKLKILGESSGRGLYGRHLVGSGGPVLVITEGELDAMSVYEANGLKYPAVSVPDGVSNADKVIAEDSEWINSFNRVVFMFDNDDPGKEAAKKCASILRPGKAYIASLPEKDASDCLLNNNKSAVVKAIWTAEPHRPDGIVHIKDVDVSNESRAAKIFTYPYPEITRATFGRRAGDLSMLTSGSGMGKSTFCRENMKHDLDMGLSVGALMLEESTAKTKQDLMSLYVQKPIHKILAARQINTDMKENGVEEIDFGPLPDLSDTELHAGEEWINSQELYVYDHFGSLEKDVLTKRIEYLHYGCGCDVIYLDHVSIVVSGNEGDERRDLDQIMTTLKSLAERTGVNITAVCHLSKPPGQSFEEGGQISLRDLRGSGSLYQLSNTVIGFERHQQHPNEKFANTMGIRVLKDRFGGNTGLKAALSFDHATQCLVPTDFEWYKNKLKEKDG